MKQTFDTDSILFGILNPMSKKMTGGVYIEERPDDSEDEDIVVNSIVLTQEFKPQLGTSNVNIHVSDLKVKIKGKQQRKANRERLAELSKEVVEMLKAAKIEGLSLIVKNQTTIKEPESKQHFVNIRIEWLIH